jgi:hypothetical protein
MNESEKIYRKYEVAISFLERENVSLEGEFDREIESESSLEAEKRQKSILKKIKANNQKVVLLNAQKEKELDEYYNEKRFNDLMESEPEVEAITPEKVKELYRAYNNKQHFLNLYGTTKFHLVDDAFLKRMHDYLIKKVK